MVTRQARKAGSEEFLCDGVGNERNEDGNVERSSREE
jgi:hypothetical protein